MSLKADVYIGVFLYALMVIGGVAAIIVLLDWILL